MGKFTEKTIMLFAESTAKLSVNSACYWFFYQEKLPKRIKEKYKK